LFRQKTTYGTISGLLLLTFFAHLAPMNTKHIIRPRRINMMTLELLAMLLLAFAGMLSH